MKFVLWYVIYIFGILETVHPYFRHTYLSILKPKLCERIVSTTEPHYVQYFDTYKDSFYDDHYTNRDRWNTKTEYSTVHRKEKVCCEGYKENTKHSWSEFACEPICNDGCIDGRCIKPNICECEIGYATQLNENSKYACVPVCSYNCYHGKCTAPEKCTCDDGYVLTNDIIPICIPQCNVPCGNGSYCDKPDHCACLEGYNEVTPNVTVSSSKNHITKICEPMCKGKCEHGKCENNTCICHNGYSLDPDDIFECKPICTPECSEETFGNCIAPNNCSCIENYKLNSKGFCNPVCEKECVHGTCISPNKCECDEGYGLLNNMHNSTFNCEPLCSHCSYGKCTAPETCTCYPGYKKHEHITTICEPICDPPCGKFGECTKPNSCNCSYGYRPTNNTQIKRIDSNDASHSISNLCEPFCEHGCDNGVCTGPNKCQCNEGYKLRLNFTDWIYRCVPDCHLSCHYCTEPNKCTCLPGYELSSSANKCIPICSSCSENEICLAPDFCTCKTNYHLDLIRYSSEKKFICKPTCTIDCGNGNCTAPDKCECSPGYQYIKRRGCEPVCKKCGNGICIEPEVCNCHHGWAGLHCDEHLVCVLKLNDDKNRSQTLKIIETYNATINDILKYHPPCSAECINELNNETLCFKNHTENNGKKATLIDCIMDYECSELWNQKKTQGNAKSIAMYTGILILIGAIMTCIYLLWKYRLQYEVARYLQNSSMQGLIESED